MILLIGAAAGAVISCAKKQPRGICRVLIISVSLYAVCEAASNIRTNYFLELILLFMGTAAIGSAASSLVCAVIYAVKAPKSSSDEPRGDTERIG